MKAIYFYLIAILILLSTYIIFNPYISMIVTGSYLIIILLYRYRRDIAAELVISMLFALFITSYHQYTYVGTNFYIGTINLYPLILWSLGLVIVREFYEWTGNKYFLTSILYIFGLLAIEFIGYHWMGVRIDSNNSGVFGLDVIHGPPIIHYFYILAGPVYLAVTKILHTP